LLRFGQVNFVSLESWVVVIFWFVWVMFVICPGLGNPMMVSWILFCFLFVSYVCYVVGELSAYPPVLTNNPKVLSRYNIVWNTKGEHKKLKEERMSAPT
jgi:hypothetical protein